jgi:hypothetical protein
VSICNYHACSSHSNRVLAQRIVLLSNQIATLLVSTALIFLLHPPLFHLPFDHCAISLSSSGRMARPRPGSRAGSGRGAGALQYDGLNDEDEDEDGNAALLRDEQNLDGFDELEEEEENDDEDDQKFGGDEDKDGDDAFDESGALLPRSTQRSSKKRQHHRPDALLSRSQARVGSEGGWRGKVMAIISAYHQQFLQLFFSTKRSNTTQNLRIEHQR